MKRILYILGVIATFLCMTGFQTASTEGNATTNQNPVDDSDFEVTGPLTMTVILERVYLDGEVSEEIVEETIWAMEDFWAEYADWQMIHSDEEQVVFQQHVDDISPLLKSNGYFGISEDGVLTIFDGRPSKSNKVIQSFFQIDIEKLESRQHNMLKKGIKVGSKSEYINVIEIFKTFTASP
ncbi:intercompartmental signaling factor BofC [Litchfieldia alkalitelluris]|uniref:intercompartmental signaling factor BofC n=1 Tax=Litchfieldia alkalitelluris TaxID=304268 RepID=UPI0009975447|nr:intercompartmental signaling factor BofC [Litchfieldia alkalitelluris]